VRYLSRPSSVVAPALLGCILVRVLADGTRLAARLVETEAYAADDPASHSFAGRTPRTEVMFGPAGHLYVYFTYGMHYCSNIVTGRRGEGSAVLLRSGEPIEGLDRMAEHRGTSDVRLLCSGPARLCQALGIGRDDNGADVVRGDRIWLERGPRPAEVSRGPRVGITRAIDEPWRYWITGDPFVSRGRPGPGRRVRAEPARRAGARPGGRGGAGDDEGRW
jgi:DNA-3-methyladenine glycosylase